MFLFFLVPIVLVVIAMLYVAYIYEPKMDFPFESKFLKKHQTHYLKSGEGEPVILLHGSGSWLFQWRHVIPVLSKYFSVYAIDMPSHGYTKYFGEPKFDLDYFTEVLHNFMNALNISKATFVGNSWGGTWALRFAQKYPVIGEIMTKLGDFYRDRGLSIIRREYLWSAYNTTAITEIDVYEGYKPYTFKENRHAMLKATRNIDYRVTEKDMSKITAPTLLLWGKQDAYLSYKLAYRFHQDIKNSEIVILDKCGHIPYEELPEITNKLILDFIKKSG